MKHKRWLNEDSEAVIVLTSVRYRSKLCARHYGRSTMCKKNILDIYMTYIYFYKDLSMRLNQQYIVKYKDGKLGI